MIQDPTKQYIATILSQYDVGGKDVLEIGCGKGRITRDLAQHARRVVASDPDADALEKARGAIPLPHQTSSSCWRLPGSLICRLQHHASYGIVLDAYRRMNLLRRTATGNPA